MKVSRTDLNSVKAHWTPVCSAKHSSTASRWLSPDPKVQGNKTGPTGLRPAAIPEPAPRSPANKIGGEAAAQPGGKGWMGNKPADFGRNPDGKSPKGEWLVSLLFEIGVLLGCSTCFETCFAVENLLRGSVLRPRRAILNQGTTAWHLALGVHGLPYCSAWSI